MRSYSKNQNDAHRYDFMLNKEHHTSGTHRAMSMEKRAAQFIPFSALSGFDEKLEESRRETEKRRELSENEREELDEKLVYIENHKDVSFTVTYFVEDLLKEGGSYQKKTGTLRRVDPVTGILEMSDRTKINIQEIDEIEISD